ncbi:MAG TPA: hypothetical protein VJU61_12930 [Polyangiaceae bacterium]|nr:hypothetical protein [Polyangiaceae bacterium]
MTSPAIHLSPLLRRAWALGLGLAVSTASVAHAEEPTLDEVRYNPTELPPTGTGFRMMLTGALLTGAWYGAAFGTSYLYEDAPNSKDLRIPIIGPWKAMLDVGCGPEESTCSTSNVVLRTTLAVVSGVGQAGGLLVFLEGLFLDTGSSTPSPAAPAKPSARSERAPETAGLSWSAAPISLPGGAGVELVGQF